MTPQQARDGLVEVILPDGGTVLVAFGDEVVSNPEVEAAVVEMVLAATGSADDVCSSLADYADASGLAAAVSTEGGSLTVVIG